MTSPEREICDALRQRIKSLETKVAKYEHLEKALTQSEERFRVAFQTSPDSINLNRLEDGLFIDVNEGFSELTGYAREDVIGKSSLAINLWADPEDREKLTAALQKNGYVRNMEARFRLKDGSVKTGLISARVIMLKEEPHVLSVARDIEDLKAAQNSIVESEEKYRLLVNYANDAIFIAQDHVLKFSNPRTWEVTGYSAEELAQKPFADFIHPEDRDAVVERYLKRIGGKDVESTYTFRVIGKSGRELWVQLNAALAVWDGRPATINFLRDITRQKELEGQLLQARKMEAIGTLAGGMAHDFNNLLMGINGRTALVMMDLDPSDPNCVHLQEIENMVKRAADLTRQILGFAGGGKYEARPIDLNDVVRDSAGLFARTRKELTIHTRYVEPVWTVEADRCQMEQVLLNLFVNAWQAMSGGGNLHIETDNVVLNADGIETHRAGREKYVRISVADSGVGMDPKTCERVFEPFFTTRRMGRGAGLGLSSVYGIVKNHGGFIRVDSKEGTGTTFFVYLPAVEEKTPVRTSKENELKNGIETILLIDDEDIILTVGRQLLEHLGYQVMTAENGKTGLEVFEKNQKRIDLVILDMVMPDMDGAQVHKRLKSISPQTKVLVSSGYSQDGFAKDIAGSNGDGFIQKPFSLKSLSRKLREILD